MSRHDELFQRLRHSVLESRGGVPIELPPAVASRVARGSGRRIAKPAELPDALDLYLDKLGRQAHAHAITEEDLLALQHAGYSEEAIFELTLAAAIGAGPAQAGRT